jgi:hypothetical protein
MIYLQHEEAEFTKTKEVFEDAYRALLEKMFNTFKEKGKTRDVGSPLHHRQSPTGMLSIAQAKCRRTESILSMDGWELNSKRLADIIEECVDASNYLLYIAALCRMLEKEI